jgi:ribonuclease BN (tRNA processing enzyme)
MTLAVRRIRGHTWFMNEKADRPVSPSLDATISRARLLGGIGAIPVLAAAGCAGSDAARRRNGRTSDTKLVILGTAGGPVPGLARQMTSHVIIDDGIAYVIDCGLGVTSQLVRAGVALADVRHVFLTHQHPDHNVEYGPLLLLSWIAGRRKPVAPLARMTADYERMQEYTAEQWSLNVGTPPFPKTFVHEHGEPGIVLRNDRVTVTCAVVNHPPIHPALAYRFDFPERSIVFSGDTTKVDALVTLAKGADVLVHEAMYYPAMALELNAMALVDDVRQQAPPDSPQRVRASVSHDHTPVDQAGACAAEAGVTTLVLSHLVPPVGVPDVVWRTEAARHFKGEIIVARDLDVI